jgi:hypothetical protein
LAAGRRTRTGAGLFRHLESQVSKLCKDIDGRVQVNGDSTAVELAKKESQQTGRYKKVCVTDPEASIATNVRNRRLEPAYKQHAVVDEVRGVIVDVETRKAK